MAGRLTFAIGEVAVLVRPGSVFYGQELTVVSPIIYGPIYESHNSEAVHGASYKVEAPWLPPCTPGRCWGARPEHLKKRPPKQDWNSLCHLNSINVGRLNEDTNQWGFRNAVV
jgi:hypothetical protein